MSLLSFQKTNTIGNYNEELLGPTVQEGLVDVVGFHVIVDGFEGMQVQCSEKVVQAVPEPSQPGGPLQLRFLLGRHGMNLLPLPERSSQPCGAAEDQSPC